MSRAAFHSPLKLFEWTSKPLSPSKILIPEMSASPTVTIIIEIGYSLASTILSIVACLSWLDPFVIIIRIL
jgi:hypothetical protein